jgi:Lipase (class 3)
MPRNYCAPKASHGSKPGIKPPKPSSPLAIEIRLFGSPNTGGSKTAASTKRFEPGAPNAPPAKPPIVTIADAFTEPEALHRLEALGAVLAPVALLAYWPDPEQIRRDLGATQDPHVFEAGHVRAVDFQTEGRSFITFRGTSSHPEYLLDADIRRAGAPPCHRGFDRAWRPLRPLVVEWLRGKSSGGIVLAGHSLGAALPIRAALDFSPNVEAVVAFAAPRVGGRDFLERCKAIDLDRRTIRFTQLTDVVSRIPPPIFGFTHTGTEVVLGYVGSQSSLARSADEISDRVGKVFPSPNLPGRVQKGRYATLLERLQPITQIIPGYGLFVYPLAGLALFGVGLSYSFHDISEHNVRKYCRRLRDRFPYVNVWSAADEWVSRTTVSK